MWRWLSLREGLSHHSKQQIWSRVFGARSTGHSQFPALADVLQGTAWRTVALCGGCAGRWRGCPRLTAAAGPHTQCWPQCAPCALVGGCGLLWLTGTHLLLQRLYPQCERTHSGKPYSQPGPPAEALCCWRSANQAASSRLVDCVGMAGQCKPEIYDSLWLLFPPIQWDVEIRLRKLSWGREHRGWVRVGMRVGMGWAGAGTEVEAKAETKARVSRLEPQALFAP